MHETILNDFYLLQDAAVYLINEGGFLKKKMKKNLFYEGRLAENVNFILNWFESVRFNDTISLFVCLF